jgi:histidinol phosphatase-like enzyme (inositol monophosphatase family)
MTYYPTNSERLEFAIKIAREAGMLTLTQFHCANLWIEQKSDGTPVTMADQDAEKLLRQRIAGRYPMDGILGEELGTSDGTSGYHWLLDPIDGTKSFIHGVPLYTTLVAVLRDDHPLLGVIFAPATSELLYAQVGGGCWYQAGSPEIGPPNSIRAPERANVSQTTDISEALFVTSDVQSYATDRATNVSDVYDRLATTCRLARTWGDGYGYLLVATGRAEVMIDPEMSLWDSASLQPIITEAGGSFTDWQGKPTIHSGDVVATNGALAEQVLAITRGR